MIKVYFLLKYARVIPNTIIPIDLNFLEDKSNKTQSYLCRINLNIVVLREQNNLWLQSHIDKKLVLTPLFMPDSSMTFCVQSRTVLWASSLPHNGDFKHKYSDLSFIT